MNRTAAVFHRDSLRVDAPTYSLVLSEAGAVAELLLHRDTGDSEVVFDGRKSDDLWRARLANGRLIFSGDLGRPAFKWTGKEELLCLSWSDNAVEVEVRFRFMVSGIDMQATVRRKSGSPIKYFYLPHELAFDVRDMRRVIFPKTYGVALYESFFRKHKRIHAGYPGPMDFFHLELARTTVSLWGRQPIADREPFSHRGNILVPSRLAVEGLREPDGRWAGLTHGFHSWVAEGESFDTPAYHIELECPLSEAVARYGRDNAIRRTLSDKASEQVLDSLRGVVVRSEFDTAEDIAEVAGRLPENSTLHYTSYLPNGFDRYYPVHLPPNERFGTEKDLGTAMQAVRDAGHITQLYTNYTWYCSDSPLLEQFGTKALQLREDGQAFFEYYYEQTGYTASMWSKEHQDYMLGEIGRLRELGCDFLLIDQMSARPFKLPFLTEDAFWDFNPQSPHPTAAAQGMADAAQRVSELIPLATEVWDNGPIDYLSNWVTTFCGYWVTGIDVEPAVEGFANAPAAYGGTIFEPDRALSEATLDPDLADISGFEAGTTTTGAPTAGTPTAGLSKDVGFFPLAHLLMHESSAFTWHDLAIDRSVSDRRMLAITLLLGFQMIYQAGSRGEPSRDHWQMFAERERPAPEWPDEPTGVWLETLAYIARTFPVVGEPITTFRELAPDRYVSQYGSTRTFANLTSAAWKIGEDLVIAGDGFLVERVRDTGAGSTGDRLRCGTLVGDSGTRWVCTP